MDTESRHILDEHNSGKMLFNGEIINTFYINSSEKLLESDVQLENLDHSPVLTEFLNNFDTNNNDESIDNGTVENTTKSSQIGDTKEFKCYICEIVFETETLLNNHLSIHSNQLPFQCDICGTGDFIPIRSIKAVNKHMSMHDEKLRAFECKFCKLRFISERNRKSHIRRYHQGGEINVKVGSEGFSAAIKSQSWFQTKHGKNKKGKDKKYQCSHCGNIYSSQNAVKRHENTHTGDIKYDCKTCGKVFTKLDCFAQHDRMHKGERPYKCDICEKSFIQLGHLRIHKRSHTGERPYICTICNRGFRHKTGLKTHNRIHTGEKPFKCKLCDSKFADAGTLRKHGAVHSKNTLKKKRIET